VCGPSATSVTATTAAVPSSSTVSRTIGPVCCANLTRYSVVGENSSRRSCNFFLLAIAVSHSVVSYVLLAHCGIY